MEINHGITVDSQLNMGDIGDYRMAVAIIPFLGALNYLNIPFAVLGLLFSLFALIVSSKKEVAVAGCVLCGVAIFLGAIRLVLGFGIF